MLNSPKPRISVSQYLTISCTQSQLFNVTIHFDTAVLFDNDSALLIDTRTMDADSLELLSNTLCVDQEEIAGQLLIAVVDEDECS